MLENRVVNARALSREARPSRAVVAPSRFTRGRGFDLHFETSHDFSFQREIPPINSRVELLNRCENTLLKKFQMEPTHVGCYGSWGGAPNGARALPSPKNQLRRFDSTQRTKQHLHLFVRLRRVGEGLGDFLTQQFAISPPQAMHYDSHRAFGHLQCRRRGRTRYRPCRP